MPIKPNHVELTEHNCDAHDSAGSYKNNVASDKQRSDGEVAAAE